MARARFAERGAAAGMQDGIDLITALATHPETARRLARKFWRFFISEVHEPDPQFVEGAAAIYLQGGTEIRPMVRYVLGSPWFRDPSVRFARYSWPAEFVARAIKEVGWQGLSLADARTPLANMGMLLFEPPNVGGWPVGPGWFSTATMLARSNFAATLVAGQKEELAAALATDGQTQNGLITAMRNRITTAPLDASPQQALASYLLAGGAWTGSAEQVATRGAGPRASPRGLGRVSAHLTRENDANLTTTLHSRRCGERHAWPCRAGISERHRAGAGPRIPTARGRVPRRRQRRAQHPRSLSGPELLQPSSHDRHSRGPGAAGRH